MKPIPEGWQLQIKHLDGVLAHRVHNLDAGYYACLSRLCLCCGTDIIGPWFKGNGITLEHAVKEVFEQFESYNK